MHQVADQIMTCVPQHTPPCLVSSLPPFRIAVEESNNNANVALPDISVLDATIWATTLVGLSLHESGILAWKLKVQHMGARPITGIQCKLGMTGMTNASRRGTAWRGPYLGVGARNLGTWQPFQPIDFVTPPFAGYVSGHATFSMAAAEVCRVAQHCFKS